MVAAILAATGMPDASAREAAEILVDTQRHGIDSHGVAHLPAYVRRLINGAIATQPTIRLVETGTSAAVIDGDNCLGVLSASRALDHACDLARKHGVGACAVRNSNHFGAALPFVARAARGGLIALAFSNAAPSMAPWGGRKAILGTNPLAAAFPRENAEPVVIDMATSVVSRGRIRKAARAGEAIPADWALDKSGSPTTDAAAALKGTVQPLAGAKGYALALAVELLCTGLSGGRAGAEVLNPHDEAIAPAGVSHLFVALDPHLFSGLAQACGSADQFASRIESDVSVTGEVPRLPGSRAHAAARDRSRNGIPLSAQLIKSLQEAAALLKPRAAPPSNT